MKIKRKGLYNYELGWHQNHSAIVVAKAAEAALVHGENIESFVRNHLKIEPLDFMLRTKVGRSSWLYYADKEVQRVSRYYASTDGNYLIKVMKPTQLQINNWLIVPHWRHIDTGAHKCANKRPSKKWIPTPPPTPEPPLRSIGVDAGQMVTLANSLQGLNMSNLDIEYYVKGARKLVDKLIR